MNFKSNKGSIAVFVFVGLLFMSAFLIIAFANIANKSKTAKEQLDIIKGIYYKENDEESYDDAYTNIRNNNYEIKTKSSEGNEDTSVIELNGTYDEDLLNYRIYGSGFVAEDEYQEVEYIENTGNQYIDTNVKALDKKIQINMDIKILDGTYFIGAGKNLGYRGEGVAFGKYNNQWSDINPGISYNTFGTWKKDRVQFSWIINNGTSILDGYEYKKTESTISYSNNCLWRNYNFTVGNVTEDVPTVYGIGQIYSIEILRDDVLVRKFIPCYRKSDHEVGMYDAVNNQFYTNQGTGTFLKGNDTDTTVGDLITDTFDDHYGKYQIKLKVINKENESYDKYIFLDNPLLEGEYIDFKTQKIYRADGTTENVELPNIKLYEDYTKIEVITNNKTTKVEAEYKEFDTIYLKYQPVEYIESTGTQWIDTNYSIQNNNAYFDISTMWTSGDVIGTIIGQGRDYYAEQWFQVGCNNKATKNWSYPIDIGIKKNKKYKILFNYNNKLIINDKEYTLTGMVNNLGLNTVSIFGMRYLSQDGKSINTTDKAKCRIYYAKIYDNDILVRDLIPCYRKSDHEVGMYDTVNDVFYTNQGTGEFIAGPEVD